MLNVNVLDILKDLGIAYQNAGPHNVRIKCFNPEHIETVPSMFVHKTLGIGQCFGCNIKFNIFGLLRSQGLNYLQAVQYLKKFVIGGTTEDEIKNYLENYIKSRGDLTTLKALEETSNHFPKHTPIESSRYLEQERGFKKEEIKFWNMGTVSDYTNEFGRYVGWIYIPIYQDSILRNYFLRQTIGSGKRYGQMPRKDLLAGIDTANDISKKIYITEGIFDMIYFRRTRNQCVAALTNMLSEEQLSLLKKYKEVVIVPDNDEMGFKLIKSANKLIHNTKVSICKLPVGKKDAAQCTTIELLESTYKEVPINQFLEERLKWSLKM